MCVVVTDVNTDPEADRVYAGWARKREGNSEWPHSGALRVQALIRGGSPKGRGIHRIIQRASGSVNGDLIENYIKDGKIVPSEITIRLLDSAMKTNGGSRFLIDGFPRNK